MTQSKNQLHYFPGIFSCLALAFAGLLLFQPALTAAEKGTEMPPVFQASKILPPELVAGPNHRVQEKVRNDGFLNIYTIDSKFGQFTTISTAMLRKRVHELNALTLMEKIQGTKEFTASMKEAGMDTLVGMKNLVTQPVDTVKGADSGLGAAFRRAGDALTGPKRSEAEDSRVKNLIGFSKTKREYAAQFGVDVYSDNKVLQDRLDEIAWAGYAGGLTWAAAMTAVPGGAGLALSISGAHKLLNELFRTTPPGDLRRMNDGRLIKMGVQSEVADLFVNNALYSPRQQTVLVYALDQMMGVANRSAFVNFAALGGSAGIAFFRQRQAEMYLGFHKKVEAIESFVPVGGLAAARTKSGALVFNVPLDHLVWTEPMARFVTGANEFTKGLSGIKQKQIWVAGSMSPMARSELERLGWQIQEQSEDRLLDEADEAYPKNQKPENRLPSAILTLSGKSVALGTGVSWSDGKLQFQGREYPFSVSGLRLIGVGVSGYSAVGKVYDLKSLSDLEGNYVGSQASLAVAGGAGDVTIKNSKGVVIVLLAEQTKQSGTKLSLGPSGVTIKLKR
jgi:hypothetical protein